MATTIDSLVQLPAKAQHRAVAFGIAAALLVGGAIGTTAVIAADNDGGAKAPTEATSNVSPARGHIGDAVRLARIAAVRGAADDACLRRTLTERHATNALEGGAAGDSAGRPLS